MNSANEAFKRAALYQACKHSSILSNIKFENADSDTLVELVNQHNAHSMRQLPILMSKAAVKIALSFMLKRFPKVKPYINADNIRVRIEQDELAYLLTTKPKTQNSILMIVLKNLVLSSLGSTIEMMKASFVENAEDGQSIPDIDRIEINLSKKPLIVGTPPDTISDFGSKPNSTVGQSPPFNRTSADGSDAASPLNDKSDYANGCINDEIASIGDEQLANLGDERSVIETNDAMPKLVSSPRRSVSPWSSDSAYSYTSRPASCDPISRIESTPNRPIPSRTEPPPPPQSNSQSRSRRSPSPERARSASPRKIAFASSPPPPPPLAQPVAIRPTPAWKSAFTSPSRPIESEPMSSPPSCTVPRLKSPLRVSPLRTPPPSSPSPPPSSPSPPSLPLPTPRKNPTESCEKPRIVSMIDLTTSSRPLQPQSLSPPSPQPLPPPPQPPPSSNVGAKIEYRAAKLKRANIDFADLVGAEFANLAEQLKPLPQSRISRKRKSPVDKIDHATELILDDDPIDANVDDNDYDIDAGISDDGVDDSFNDVPPSTVAPVSTGKSVKRPAKKPKRNTESRDPPKFID